MTRDANRKLLKGIGWTPYSVDPDASRNIGLDRRTEILWVDAARLAADSIAIEVLVVVAGVC